MTRGSRIAEFESFPHQEPENVNAVVQLDGKLIDGATPTITVGDNLSTDQFGQLKKLVLEYFDIFSYNGGLGKTNLAEHKIELKANTSPVVEPLRRNALVENKEISRQVQDILDKGVIEEAKSPWASAIVLVKKKNGKLRFCIDFRKPNESTIVWKYPLPRIDDMIDNMRGRKYFTCLDLASGYWQIEMEEDSRPLTAFRTRDGQYQFRRMPFGLVNSGASFQKLVDVLFFGLNGLELQVYVDDICIASSSWLEHISTLREVFRRISTAGLIIQHEKCTFGISYS